MYIFADMLSMYLAGKYRFLSIWSSLQGMYICMYNIYCLFPLFYPQNWNQHRIIPHLHIFWYVSIFESLKKRNKRYLNPCFNFSPMNIIVRTVDRNRLSSPPCIDSLATSPKEGHGGPGTKRAVLDQRLVCEVVRILYKRFNFVKIQYNSSASSYMIMMPCLLMIMMIMKNLSELPFSQRWEKQQGWPCKKRWWSTWRTTRSLPQFALRRPEQPKKWIIYNFTSQLRSF